MSDLDKWAGKRIVAATRLARYEARLRIAVVKALRARFDRALGSLQAAAGPVDPFGLDDWNDQLQEELSPVVESVLGELREGIRVKFGATSLSTLKIDGQLQRMVGLMNDLGADAATRLESELSIAIREGESLAATATRVKNVLGVVERRAATIARTETAIAVNSFEYGTASEIHNSGFPLWKTWLATAGARPTHMEADGSTVPFDQQFDVGGDSLDYPSDPAGSAGEIVNCRCSVIFSDSPDGA